MKLKRIVACLLAVFCVAGFSGCENEPENNSKVIENEESQSLNTALELKTATFMISDEWDVIDLSDKDEVGEFEYLVGAFNYVVVANDDLFFAIEEYTIDGADSSDDILLEEYTQRNEPNTTDIKFLEIDDENCAVLTYSEKEIVYCFVENSVHYKFYAAFNEDIDDSMVSNTIQDIILTFDQHISSSEVLDEIAVSLDNKVDLDETATVEDATFSVSSDWEKESKDDGYNWYANDLSFFRVNTTEAKAESETEKKIFLTTFYNACKNMENVKECSEMEEIEIDSINGIAFSTTVAIENYGERKLKFYCVIFNGKSYAFGFTNIDEDSNEILKYEDDIISSIKFTAQSTTLETKDELITETTTEKATESVIEDVTAYYSGTYKVGEDIPAGEYCVFATENKRSGYYSVNADSNGDDIIGNEIFDYNAFVTISDGQYLELNRAKAIPVEEIDEIETDQSGMFRVGIDIPSGEYKLKSTKDDLSGYYCIYNSSAPNASIVVNDLFDGQTYVTVSDGQYLVLERCSIIQ